MATVLNRATLELLPSVNTPDYVGGEWLVNPDLAAVGGVPRRYWKIVDNLVMEMDASEKEAVDAALIDAARAARKAVLEAEFLLEVAARYPGHRREALLSLYAGAVAAGLSARAAYIRQLQSWVEDGLRGRLYPAQDAVDAAANEAAIDAVELDLDDWLAADPRVAIRGALEIED